ncbi:MAG: 4-hydroxy-tetrahydrodipicolinate synthase [Frankiales bacterium]|jgi:4-hydroxy-tetrahydrodipicolinate synthase|nr:4-hydroxy-tetrahydrodipicolinate synthase [Frankiales bacterium]
MTAPPFGRVLTAMVTPFTSDGDVDLKRAGQLAERLVSEGNDGLVVSGTTGEAPTTHRAEKADLLRAVVDAVGGRAHVVAGVGSNDTVHAVGMAQDAEKAGASGLLVVTPYYNKPPQAGVIAHTRTVVEATSLPVLLYDIPGRTGLALAESTILTLAEHPQVVGLKDAKLDLESTSWVLKRTDLAYYSGHDPWTLPMLALGAVGVVGTSTHLVGRRTQELIEAFLGGDHVKARALHEELLPIYTGIFRTQGTILVKAALGLLGFPVGGVRLPLVEATPDEVAQLTTDLKDAGVL